MDSLANDDQAPNRASQEHVTQHDVDFGRPSSPEHMPSGQIDCFESLEAVGTTNSGSQSPYQENLSDSGLSHLHMSPVSSAAQVAFSAMQYLPCPLMVLNGLKTLVLANDAMVRLLGIEDDDDDTASHDGNLISDRLKGQRLSQMGIDMHQDGTPIWVMWDTFLDSISEDTGLHIDEETVHLGAESMEGDLTPTAERSDSLGASSKDIEKSMVRDVVVEVVLTPPQILASHFTNGSSHVTTATFAKMIITVWEIERERFFTLTFTSTDRNHTSVPSSTVQTREVMTTAKHSSIRSISSGSGPDSASQSSPPSVSSGRSSAQGGTSRVSARTSSTTASMSASPFPPLGPPSKKSRSNWPSSLQKIVMMKEALLDNTQTPVVAMWKDESLTIPNKAARRLFHPSADLGQIKDGAELVTKWHAWDETFTTRLDPSEYPISVLVRTQTPFSSFKIGMFDPETGQKMIFDVQGDAIRDETTGEFLAGIITCKDITGMTQQISDIKQKDEQRFQLICDSMPQMIWTSTPKGMHDCKYFSAPRLPIRAWPRPADFWDLS